MIHDVVLLPNALGSHLFKIQSDDFHDSALDFAHH
jgi:hypothetical protein